MHVAGVALGAGALNTSQLTEEEAEEEGRVNRGNLKEVDHPAGSSNKNGPHN